VPADAVTVIGKLENEPVKPKLPEIKASPLNGKAAAEAVANTKLPAPSVDKNSPALPSVDG